jgi:radical SAM protein with 4Fe4S-binding SPASM domain
MITDKIDNITHIPEEYKSANPPCPKSVKIELTGRCNYRCGFCALRMRDNQPKPDDDMDLEFFKKITTEMFNAGVEEMGVFYLGESLMNPNLTVKAIEFLKQTLGMPYVFLTTNGSLCNEYVAHRLMAAGLDSLKFSMNASDTEQFEEVMGVKAKWYEQSLKNLKRTYEIRESAGYATRIYASSIRYDGDQQARMEELVSRRIRPYVDEHYWLPLYSMGSVATEREAELGYKPTAGNQGRIGGLVKPLPCWSAFTEGHVRSDGQVSLCCFDADGRFQVGNLHENTWMDIWHNEKFTKVREAHLKEDLKGTVCEECVAY